jgi:hypothetical protein
MQLSNRCIFYRKTENEIHKKFLTAQLKVSHSLNLNDG